MLDRLSHAAIGYATELDAMLEFYRKVFGLVQVHRRGEEVFLSGGRKYGYDLILGPWDAGLRHFTFQVGSKKDIAAIEEKARAAGAHCEEIDVFSDHLVDSGIRIILPAGHLMEVIVRTPGRATDALPLISREHFQGGGPLTIEHISISCEDVEPMVRFCETIFGFKISEFSRRPSGPWFMSFLRCKEQHHDLGIFKSSPGWTGPALDHIAYAVPSVAEIVRVADAARSLGYALECSPGRHVLGDNIFVYLRDPTGNRIEVGTPLSRVDVGTPIKEFDVSTHEKWSNFDAWRKDAPPVSRLSLPCHDARK